MERIPLTTASVEPARRAQRWNDIINETYFPLQLTFRETQSFGGRLVGTPLGETAVSKVTSSPLQYERLPSHVRDVTEEIYLVSIPCRSTIEFEQVGRQVHCSPGFMIVERGDAPYRFSYAAPTDLLVFKLPKAQLAERLRNPDRLCATAISLGEGLGRLFKHMVDNVTQLGSISEAAQEVLGGQLVELLALMLDGEQPTASSSTIRAAHLSRAQAFIRAHLKDASLSPVRVAEACGISKRYLHKLFAEDDRSVAQYIRNERLAACRSLLQAPNINTITQIAYAYGFCDSAQFSRLFKAHFGEAPHKYRIKYRH